MKKYFSCLSLILTALLPIPSFADSFDTILSDLSKRVTFVENSANCLMKNSDGYSCQTVIAKCPTGKKLIPFLSNCKGSLKNDAEGYISVDKNNNNEAAQLECNIGYAEIMSYPATINIKSTAACSKFTAAQISTWKNFADKIRH
jgi:hypothetical protein